MIWTILEWSMVFIGAYCFGFGLLCTPPALSELRNDSWQPPVVLLVGAGIIYWIATQPLHWYGISFLVIACIVLFICFKEDFFPLKNVIMIIVSFGLGLACFAPEIVEQTGFGEKYIKSPSGQLKEVRNKQMEVKKKLEKDLKRLQTKYKEEKQKLRRQVRKKIKESRVKTHKELLNSRERHKALKHYLERLSILEFNLKWLSANINKAENNLLDLEQAEWKLEHFIEMSKVASEEDMKEISKVILTAKATLDDKMPTPQRHDLAELQQRLFKDLR